MKNQEREMARMEAKDFPECYTKPKLDFSIEDHGSIMLFRPHNKPARAWLKETAPEDAQFLGAAMAVEPRFASGVVDAIFSYGFSCGNFP